MSTANTTMHVKAQRVFIVATLLKDVYILWTSLMSLYAMFVHDDDVIICDRVSNGGINQSTHAQSIPCSDIWNICVETADHLHDL